MIKQIEIPLKGTSNSFYVNWREYKVMRKKAKEKGMTVIDYVQEMFAEALTEGVK